MRFLDNVLTHFIDVAPDGMKRARYAALRERSVGLGVMGFHSFLQSQNIPFESALAKSWNLKMFRKIRRDADAASVALAKERGSCPDAAERNIAGALQPQDRDRADGVDQHHLRRHQRLRRADPGQYLYAQDAVRRVLACAIRISQKVLAEKGADTQETWQSIIEHEGSVQHLDMSERA